MNDERQNQVKSNFEALKKARSKKEDKEFGNYIILANTRRPYNVQDEFVYLLYNDIVKKFLEKRRENDLSKSVSGKELQKESSPENDEGTRNGGLKCNEKSFDKGSKFSDLKLTLPDEYVEVEFPNKNNYVGRVIRGQMEGTGRYRWRSGETYKGEFLENSIKGKGRMEWKDQSWYEGEFHKGYRHGTGNYVSHEYRRFYIGQWHMGQKNGNGYCRYGQTEDYYEGEWKMNKKQGTGYRVYENGTRYIGQWENDQRNGIGTMVWSNGDVYRGDWKNGTMNGYGEYVWKGFFNRSLSWPQENIYMGDWLDGMRHGRGDLKLNSTGGAKYSGEWYMDKKHGRGMIIGNSGVVTEADPLFLNDNLTPLSTDAKDFQKLDPELTSVKNSNERFPKDEKSHCSTGTKISEKGLEPRKIAIFEPLHSPSLSYHVQRLLEPLTCPEKSFTVFTSSGKCRVCKNDSECSCLYVPSGEKSTETSGTIETPLVLSSSGNSYDESFCKNLEKFKTENNSQTRRNLKQYEEHWVRNCLRTHMLQLRKIYKLYAELYCSQKHNCRNLSMGKIALWQLMRDTGIHKRGISLVQFERHIAKNKSAFIEAEFYPFERIEFFQYIQTLLEISWHLYTKQEDIEIVLMRGKLAGGLHRLLVKDIFPNAGKLIGNVSTVYRDLLPIYSVYQLYRELGEPHTAKQFLRATCILTGADDPKPLPFPKPESKFISRCFVNGINAITVGEKLSYIPLDDELEETSFSEEAKVYEDDLARELFALRHLGAPKMLAIMAIICPGIKDEETGSIINMDYEFTFLEFYEILLEATQALLSMKKISSKLSETSGQIVVQTSSQSVKSSTKLKHSTSSIPKTKTKK